MPDAPYFVQVDYITDEGRWQSLILPTSEIKEVRGLCPGDPDYKEGCRATVRTRDTAFGQFGFLGVKQDMSELGAMLVG